jgi:hypothetical protein
VQAIAAEDFGDGAGLRASRAEKKLSEKRAFSAIILRCVSTS